jgi:hypothetical protein
MKIAAKRSAVAAVVLFIVLFAFRLAMGGVEVARTSRGANSFDLDFSISKKNYASVKTYRPSQSALPPGETQKYEKIAKIAERTTDFDGARKKINELITGTASLIQYEQLSGLPGRRTLQLGVGVPPAKFDAFIKDVGKLARLTSLSIVKNDKTNEFRELRAKRETFEKASKALNDLGASGGSVDERLKVQEQLTKLEQKIRELGVSLGDFDSQNEFCTVKLSLAETSAPRVMPWSRRLFSAFEWASWSFFSLAGAYLMLWIAFWISSIAVAMALRVTRTLGQEQ